MNWWDVLDELTPHLERGDISACIERVSEIVRGLPETSFHQVLDLHFTNDPKEVAAHFNQFAQQQSELFPLQAIYTETNGFDINPDRWYYNVFSNKVYGGHKDYDWLGYWENSSESVTLTGMESLQMAYANRLNAQGTPTDNSIEVVVGFCSLLVLLHFQNLIRLAAPYMSQVRVPVLATAHDYDFIYEILPNTDKNFLGELDALG